MFFCSSFPHPDLDRSVGGPEIPFSALHPRFCPLSSQKVALAGSEGARQRDPRHRRRSSIHPSLRCPGSSPNSACWLALSDSVLPSFTPSLAFQTFANDPRFKRLYTGALYRAGSKPASSACVCPSPPLFSSSRCPWMLNTVALFWISRSRRSMGGTLHELYGGEDEEDEDHEEAIRSSASPENSSSGQSVGTDGIPRGRGQSHRASYLILIESLG